MRKLILLLSLAGTSLSAQVPKSSPLFTQLQKHDSIFFERGFNRCDSAYLQEMTHPGLMFYHDRSGIQNKRDFLTNTRQHLCSNINRKPIRKVRKESLELFPLYNNGTLYGVVQNGIHDFYIREPGKPDAYTGTARFTHVYLLISDQWILKEVLSFDHH